MKYKKVVFIAEDDPALLKMLTIALTDEFEVHTAENGEIAWDYIKNNQIDCLITDMDMPKMNGLELIRKMRETDMTANIIVTTGSPSPQVRKECESLGVSHFLTKPYNMFSLSKMINAGDEPFIMQTLP